MCLCKLNYLHDFKVCTNTWWIAFVLFLSQLESGYEPHMLVKDSHLKDIIKSIDIYFHKPMSIKGLVLANLNKITYVNYYKTNYISYKYVPLLSLLFMASTRNIANNIINHIFFLRQSLIHLCYLIQRFQWIFWVHHQYMILNVYHHFV